MQVVLLEPASLVSQGDQVHRTKAPAEALAALGHRVVTGSFMMPPMHAALTQADVVVLVQSVDVDLVALMAARRRANKVTLVEINDDFTDEHSFGEVGSFYHQPRIRATLMELAAMADGLVVSTPELMRRFGHLNERVCIVPNAAPARVVRAERKESSLRLGWAGSAGHARDWPAFVPELTSLLVERPDLQFHIMAPLELRPLFAALPGSAVHWHAPGSFAQYMAFIAQLDVGLAPLGASAFARGRSDVKWVEYAQAGVAAVLSDEPPYGHVEHGKAALLARDPREMMAQARCLLDDAERRRQLVEGAQAYLTQERSAAVLARRREAFFVRCGAPTPGPSSVCARPDIIHLRCAPRERRLFAGLRKQHQPQAAYPILREAAEQPDAEPFYLPHLYAAHMAPDACSFGRHIAAARQCAPDALSIALLELERLAQRGRFGQALRFAQCELMRLGPYTLLWHQLACAMTALGHRAGSIEAWRKVALAWPDCASSAWSLAHALVDDACAAGVAKPEVALELVELCARAQRGGVATMWEGRTLRARLAIAAKNPAEAVRLLAPALRERNPKDATLRPALALLAQQALAVGQHRAAQAAVGAMHFDVRDAGPTLSS